MEQETKELLSKAQAGNEDAFAVLFQRHYPFLYKYLLKLTLDEELSRDLAQETMLKCYMKISSFKGESKFSTWMLTIATRLYTDQVRRNKRERRWLDEAKLVLSRKLSWEASAKGIEWSETFADFNRLDPGTRVPILLHYYYGYTHEEIGSMLHLKPGTVKSRIHYGLKKLRKE